MKRILVPIFQDRVSPVFDSCTRILVIDVQGKREIDREAIYLDSLTIAERVPILRRLKPSVVICGGISEEMDRILDLLDIHLVQGVAGNVDEVVEAYLLNRIDDPLYCMPGFRNLSP